MNRTAAIYWLRPAPIACLTRPLSGRRIRPPIEWRTRTGRLRPCGAGAAQPSKATRTGIGSHLAPKSLYDALSLKRTKLPPLGLVLAIVRACRGENEAEWRYAWGALSLLEQAATDLPSPPEAGPEPPPLLRHLPS